MHKFSVKVYFSLFTLNLVDFYHSGNYRFFMFICLIEAMKTRKCDGIHPFSSNWSLFRRTFLVFLFKMLADSCGV